MAEREIVATPLASLSEGVAGQLAEACAMYRDLCDQELAVSAAKKGLMDDVIKPLMKANGLDAVDGGKWVAQKVVRTTSKIQPEILLGEGVAMETINKATVSTKSEYYQVVAVKKEKASVNG